MLALSSKVGHLFPLKQKSKVIGLCLFGDKNCFQHYFSYFAAAGCLTHFLVSNQYTLTACYEIYGKWLSFLFTRRHNAREDSYTRPRTWHLCMRCNAQHLSPWYLAFLRVLSLCYCAWWYNICSFADTTRHNAFWPYPSNILRIKDKSRKFHTVRTYLLISTTFVII